MTTSPPSILRLSLAGYTMTTKGALPGLCFRCQIHHHRDRPPTKWVRGATLEMAVCDECLRFMRAIWAAAASRRLRGGERPGDDPTRGIPADLERVSEDDR